MKRYGQFCPVAKAAEVCGERWTLLIVRELLCGSHRFNEIRRGNPLISPSILSQRLRSLEDAGIVEKRTVGGEEAAEYHLTPAGEALGPIVMQLGDWGQRWLSSQLSSADYDPALLMWDMRRNIRTGAFPPGGRRVVQFEYRDAPRTTRFWWLVVEADEVDLCMKNPGYEADLVIRTTVPVMVEAWMGETDVRTQVRNGSIEARGDRALKRDMHLWLGYSVFRKAVS